MNNGQKDLFSMFGFKVTEPVVDSKTKKAKVKPKSKGKIEKKSVQEIEESFNLPLTIQTGYRDSLDVIKETNGKDRMTLQELKLYLHACYPEYAESYTNIAFSKDKKIAYAAVDSAKVQEKGDIKITDKSKLSLGGVDYDLSSIMTDTECIISLEDIRKLLCLEHGEFMKGIGIATDGINSQMMILPIGSTIPEKMKFPISYIIPGRKAEKINEEDFKSFLESNGNLIEEGEEMFDRQGLESLILSRQPEFGDGHLLLQYVEESDLVLVKMQVMDDAEKNTDKKKKDMFPTVDVILSFIFRKIELSPDMFNGKIEITEDELISYCQSIYPEYSKERTKIEYDKSAKLLIPVLKGSKKGANTTLEIVTTRDEYHKRINSNSYDLFSYEALDGCTYRVESSSVSLTAATYSSCVNAKYQEYQYRLPKFSGGVRYKLDALFRKVSEVYQSEVLMMLFYDESKQEYFFEMPEQKVRGDKIIAHYDELVATKYYPIADFHSHCYHAPMFSDIDNKDELGNRIYGVFGSYQNTKLSDCYRAGTGGMYVPITASEIFTEETAAREEIREFVDMWMQEAIVKLRCW